MKFAVAASACLIRCAMASPISARTVAARAASLFSDPLCALSPLVPEPPLGFLYPTASELGDIIGPVLAGLIGTENVERVDSLADTLCVNSQEETANGRGICAVALQAVKDIVNAAVPATQAAKYKCLLDLLCISDSGLPADGTCQALLRGADCVANRLLQAQDLECEGGDGLQDVGEGPEESHVPRAQAANV